MERCYPISLDTARRLFFHPKAERTSICSAYINFSNGCSNAVTIQLVGLPCHVLDGARKSRKLKPDRTELVGDQTHIWFEKRPAEYSQAREASNLKLFITMDTCSRKCHNCLKRRSRLWAARAFNEVRMSSRTWFVTFTVNPEHRVRAKILAQRKYGDESFSSVAKIISSWYTLFMKRVRKNSGAKLRYLMAIEEHKDGFPHLHALVHEMGVPLTKRELQAEWPYGFTNCKLTDPAASRYVTKYLAKSQMARVRASLKYGQVGLLSSSDIGGMNGTGVTP